MKTSETIEALAISLSGKAAGSRLLKLTLDAEELGHGLLGRQYGPLRRRAAEIFEQTLEKGDHIITLRDPRYPEALKNVYDPPGVLFLRGDLSLLKPRRFSIVGTRSPSLLSCHWIKEIANYLSSRGLITVSGMAAGIDETVHRNSPGGTIAVPAGPLDHVYPCGNRDLYERSRQKHNSHNILLLTEMPPGAGIKRYHFTRRNRIIAALSEGVLFAEGGLKSGAISTIEYARKYNRQLFLLNHAMQQNNEGAKALLQTGVRDISAFFPLELIRKEPQNFISTGKSTLYLGEGRFIKFLNENFSLEFLSPAQQDLVFEPQNG